ncbi:MAG: EamA family transporter [Candidatus Nanoarchaeia archaeon]|nr:EamA family transporter [Candidatus Nanoarchaeia archaeon]
MIWLAYALGAMALQGLVIFIVKAFSFRLSPLLVLLFQYIGSILLLSLYLKHKKINLHLDKLCVKKVFASGFLVSTGLSLYYLALGLAEASKVATIQSVGVTVLPVLFAFLILKEKVTKRLFAGLVFAVMCILFLTI